MTKPLERMMSSIRNSNLPTKNDPEKPVAVWKDKARNNGRPINCLNIILRTTGCSWGRESGCSMCGYIYDSAEKTTVKDLKTQIDTALKKHELEPPIYIKIFTSGSFLDEEEVPIQARKYILQKVSEKEPEILGVESRPEFIKKEKIKETKEYIQEFEVGLGIESTNNQILNEIINKNATYQEYKSAIKTIQKSGGKVKAYLLLKPPLLTEREAIIDTTNSIEKLAKNDVNKISINPCNVQRGTFVEQLYNKNQYRPPWLWSLLEVLKKTSEQPTEIISDPVGGGKERGIHNCGECDTHILNTINHYSLHQEEKYLHKPKCDCKNNWQKTIEYEGKSHKIYTGCR
ncbi:archaeosine biosynthesis radical SAM protein RaSEA [Methanonatronarchaeum sp. AMET-Sl]|uniref:archaeosine biosynthesis radical SAM protein RaSEA n=1 Tax=Methanonatronarchaeum sp. AMET-Sl TaxID=3037654 RepID=UPI00244DE8EC|nr:archaeosine biosynthesis radical SAM protein RaSEA [Methanonatronarchaeum sp. AMET-Sl]WGI17385.1 archaeosine biosynthesis radical SAM protein RaSEA [Methanonatronarchaeum sp. AMET-Sl]